MIDIMRQATVYRILIAWKTASWKCSHNYRLGWYRKQIIGNKYSNFGHFLRHGGNCNCSRQMASPTETWILGERKEVESNNTCLMLICFISFQKLSSSSFISIVYYANKAAKYIIKSKLNEKQALRETQTLRADTARPPARYKHTHTHTHKQDRLQYTAPLASAQCKYKNTRKQKVYTETQ